MSAVVLGLAVTARKVGVVVLTLENLERHDAIGLDGPNAIDYLRSKVRAVMLAHAPSCVAVTTSTRATSQPALAVLLDLIRPLPCRVYDASELKRWAKRAGVPSTNRSRAAAYAERFPSIRPRVPKIPPLRSVRTTFERHHEVVFRALLVADLTLIDSLTPELPIL